MNKSQAPYLDAHTHAHFAAFEADYKEVINRALENNVWLINVGTQSGTSHHAVEVAHEFEHGVYAAIGLHPTHTSKSHHDEKELGLPVVALAKEGGGEVAKSFTSRGEGFDYDYYKKLAEDPKVVAIGECGLDYYRLDPISKEKQIEAFKLQMKLAEEVGKPLMIHCRPSKGSDDAYEDMLHILETHPKKIPSIFHFYVGSPAITEKLVAYGASFTFGGVITFAREYDDSINLIPLDRIFSETDAPYVTPAPYRGKRNEPVYVIEVVKKLAELKNISLDEMREQIFKNAEKIFKFS